MEFIELPYHTNAENKDFAYLVSNSPQSNDSLCISLIKFYKQKPIEYYKTKDISGTYFYKKNKKTSYFLSNADDPGGFSSEVLNDYFYGINGYENRSGLGLFLCFSCSETPNDKYIYKFIYFKNDERITDTLRNECEPNWYELHKDNELVRLFNEGEPFE